MKMLMRSVLAFAALLAMCGPSKAETTSYSCRFTDDGDDIGKVTFTIDKTEERVFVDDSPREDSMEAQDVKINGDDVEWVTRALAPTKGEQIDSTYSFNLSKMSGTWSDNDGANGTVDNCERQ